MVNPLMAKLTLASLTSSYRSNAALNANFDAIEAAIENTLSRDGTSPNAMAANLDMGSNLIVNLADPTAAQEGATKNYVDGLAVTVADINAITHSDGVFIVSDGTSWVGESGATARASLGLTIGTDVQAYDAGLQDISGLATTDGNIIVGNGSNWVAESGATARTSLGLGIGTDVQAYDAGLTSLAGLTTAADKMVYTTALDTYAVTDLSSFARTVLDDATAKDARTTLDVNSKYVATISALKALTGGDFDLVEVGGHTSANDGGGGLFIWDGSDTTADDNAIYIQPNAGGTGRWIRQVVGSIAVEAFGATGTSDDSAAVQAAMTYSASNDIEILVSQDHDINGATLTIASGLRMSGAQNGARLFDIGSITATGSGASELALSSPMSAGDTSVAVTTATLSAGDWVKLSSVINSGSTDAGEYQLHNNEGYDTYLSEFRRIKSIDSGSALTLESPVFFPYSNTAGSDTNVSYTTSILNKITWVENVVLRGIEFVGDSGTSDVLSATFAKDWRVEGCVFDVNDRTGAAVRMTYGHGCRFEGGAVMGRKTSATSAGDNVFRLEACTDVAAIGMKGFDGYQTFDISLQQNDTYRGGIGFDNKIIGCSAFGAANDGFTTHPGVVNSQVRMCSTNGCARGFRARGRGDLFSGLTARSGAASGIGISVTRGFAQGARITDFNVDGFLDGISVDIADPADTLPRSMEVYIGLGTVRNAASNGVDIVEPDTATASRVGVTIDRVKTIDCGGDHIYIAPYNNGTTVVGCSGVGIGSGDSHIRYFEDIAQLTVKENHSIDVDGAGYSVRGPGTAQRQDTVTFATAAEMKVHIGRHYGDGTSTGISHTATETQYAQDIGAESRYFSGSVEVNGDVDCDAVTASGESSFGSTSVSEPVTLSRLGSSGAVGVLFENDAGTFALRGDPTGTDQGSMFPTGDGAINLGRAANEFNDIYAKGIRVDAVPVLGAQQTTGVSEATFVENSGGTAVNVDSTFGGYTLQQIAQALQNHGLLA